MLLLSGSRCGGSSLNLSMLSHQRRMLLLGLVGMGLGRMVLLLWLLLLLLLLMLLLLLLLMLQPRRISLRILMLVGKDVLRLCLKHGGPTKDRSTLGD
jgi:hypothetical protein